MTEKPIKPAAPNAAPVAPVDPTLASIVVESNDIEIETNTAFGVENRPVAESVIDDTHPQGIIIETFVGIQPGVNWAEPKAGA